MCLTTRVQDQNLMPFLRKTLRRRKRRNLLFSHVLVFIVRRLPRVLWSSIFSLFLSLCRSLSASVYILFPHFSHLPSSLSLSVFPDSGPCALLLHVDTPAPPCSSHNWLPGFIFVHCTHTRERRPDTEGEREGGGVVAAGAWAWSPSTVDLGCSNIWFKR